MKGKFLFGLLLVILGVVGITLVLANENALVFHPKGIIAQSILHLILLNFILMWLIIVPTYIFLFAVVYKYCIKGEKGPDQEASSHPWGELILWILPAIIVLVMSFVLWDKTHELNPYKPLESEVKPLMVEVVALDWKWLFIYPELGIASLNYLHIPEKTPIHLRLTADEAPMNSFWIPQLSGQIYAMTGMTTQLHLMADGLGEYRGHAVEINGEGYSGMTFLTKSSSQKEFEAWVAEVKKSPSQLTEEVYAEMVKPAIDQSIRLFSDVKPDLFHHIILKYMYPMKPVL